MNLKGEKPSRNVTDKRGQKKTDIPEKPYKPGKSFADDWAKNTYTGRAVAGAVRMGKQISEHLMEPAYRPGKGDRLTTVNTKKKKR